MSIDKEKVRELALKVRGNDAKVCEVIIQGWLEQNQPTPPQVVGLSDEQVDELFNYFPFKATKDEFIEGYQEWLKTQAFSQPEVKEIAVGLSDGQVTAFACYCGLSITEQSKLRCELKKWLKAQTFAQPNTLLEYQLDEARKEINRVESLNANLLKQQFQPDWDDAPDDVVCCQTVMQYLNEKHEIRKIFLVNVQQRPKPTQQVEAGQVWVCTANKKHYLIKRIETLEGEVKINNGKWEKDLVLVTYWHKETAESPREYSRTLSDFLAKFERVI